ncbi:arabinan endo-1,5-alpha-L-arabinosidase [Paenibacillus sp. Soil724D2]|uniref:arabinan endo-1,5-alpha-L-arabinosidase n=1 Tax=Paenibacillus sp. (strain Soil724D2) TaxID=1736392 RepID=UPI00071449DE|nr:arabinan endo-1,5-alpha-L-arabinosidase [Paenibacillus sp. Soil724D2]KRE50118.1 beta-xylosidase [Paenibacillus sp. Soil724D2]
MTVSRVKKRVLLTLGFALAAVAVGASFLQFGSSNTAPLEFPKRPVQYPMYDTGSTNTESGWHTMNTHDPSIYKDGDTYYVFSTDIKVGANKDSLRPGIMVRRSKDLITWDWVGYALDGIPKEAASWTRATNLWAPDVFKMGDTYYLYYAASTFGSNQSMIGLATSTSITGPWTDQGTVVKTAKGDEANAIDPNPVFDAEGKPWLAYGSFFGGIYLVKLDEHTGKVMQGEQPTLLARRDSRTVAGAVEAPYIIYQPDQKKYYLFVSYDSLSSDYSVRVGRSSSITGPYEDFNGHQLSDTGFSPQTNVGNKLIGSYAFSGKEGWIAPGHNSILKDCDRTFLVHHARGEKDKNWSYLHIRELLWTRDGWPVASPERYAGEKLQSLSSKLLAGHWDRLPIPMAWTGTERSEPMTLQPNGKIESAHGTGKWTFQEPNELTLQWTVLDTNEGVQTTEKVLVSPAWDWENDKLTLVFTGMNEKGINIWGKYTDRIKGE